MRINSAVIGPHVTADSDRSATITCQKILSAILSIAENRFLSVVARSISGLTTGLCPVEAPHGHSFRPTMAVLHKDHQYLHPAAIVCTTIPPMDTFPFRESPGPPPRPVYCCYRQGRPHSSRQS